MTTKHTPATPLPYPLTEAAQDVPGHFPDFHAYRDEQAARLYRHGCKMEGDRAKLVEALRESADDADRAGGSKADLNSILDAISQRANTILRELKEDA